MAEENGSGVYQITNTVTGDRYIGSSANISQRWHGHRTNLRTGTHWNPFLQNSWNKYGEQAFLFQVIEPVERVRESLISREQYYLDTEHPEYNMRPTAESMLGYKQSIETRQKQSISGKKRKPNPERVAKMAATKRGKKFTPEHCQHISEGKKGQKPWITGKKHTPESLARMSAALKGHSPSHTTPHTPEAKAKMSAALKGTKRVFSEEHKKNLSAGLMGHRVSEEARTKMSVSHKGKALSPEHRRSLSIANFLRWERWREAKIAEENCSPSA